MTIKLKILVAMGLAFVVALVIGGASLQSLYRVGDNVRDIYENQLGTIVDVQDIRVTIYDDRSTLNQALLKAAWSNEDAAAVKNNLEKNSQLIDKKWAQYFPAQVDTDEERAVAESFAADRVQNEGIQKNLLALLDSGQHAQAVDLMTHALNTSFRKETDEINKIVEINQGQAHDEYEAAMGRQRSAMVLGTVILALGGTRRLFQLDGFDQSHHASALASEKGGRTNQWRRIESSAAGSVEGA